MSTADSVSDSASSTSASRFSLVVGGPFNSLLRHLRLTETDLLPTWRAAVLFKGLAWAVPAVLVLAQSMADPG